MTAHFLALDADQPQRWAQIKHFHKTHKLAQPLHSDPLFALELDGKILGVARFVPVEQACWLRGLFIIESHRRQGLGQQLIASSLNQLTQPVYAFALPHLAPFYQSLGFEPQDFSTLIPPLQLLFKRYQAQKAQLQIWCFNSSR